MLRKNQRALNKAMRDLDRERMHLESQEKKVIVDIKKMAKMGQMVWRHVFSLCAPINAAIRLGFALKDAVKVMAKDLVRTRQASKKFMLMKANIQAVSLKITTLKSNHAMAQAMKGVTKAMATMNKKVSKLRCSASLIFASVFSLWAFLQMNLPEIQRIMMEFEKQSEMMNMKEEMMDDAIDMAMGDDDDEEEG